MKFSLLSEDRETRISALINMITNYLLRSGEFVDTVRKRNRNTQTVARAQARNETATDQLELANRVN